MAHKSPKTIQTAHLLNSLALNNVFIPHFDSRVQEPLDEVSWVYAHQVGSFVCTWRQSTVTPETQERRWWNTVCGTQR